MLFLSVVTSIKDYIEISHKLIELDHTSIHSQKVWLLQNYTEFGAMATFFFLSLKNFLISFISLNWLKNLWSLPIIVPDIASAMVSEISVLDGFMGFSFPMIDSFLGSVTTEDQGRFLNNFTFLEIPISSYLHTDNQGNQNINIYVLEKFFIGFINSFFLFLPTSTAHIITLRRFVMQGLEAGSISALGTIAGNLLWISSVIFGWRFFVIPWLSFDIFRYLLGFMLLVKYMWDSSYIGGRSASSATVGRIANVLSSRTEEAKTAKQGLLPLSLDLALQQNMKIFLLNFLLALTEQTSIYPFIKNLSIAPESSILETFPAQTFSDFILVHSFYILGLLIGSLSLLKFTCWFWENPVFNLYMWFLSKERESFLKNKNILTSSYSKILNFSFLYLTMLCAISSFSYFGLDYTITNPLGFLPQDRLINQKNYNQRNTEGERMIREASFLSVDSTDKNDRRREGVKARQERWKERLIKYQAFDSSLYDRGIYSFFTLEDLNYGFDRFWLRRKMRNHKPNFRLIPGPFIRDLKKRLNTNNFLSSSDSSVTDAKTISPENQILERDRTSVLNPVAKPRTVKKNDQKGVEFFRLLFEQYYDPTFHKIDVNKFKVQKEKLIDKPFLMNHSEENKLHLNSMLSSARRVSSSYPAVARLGQEEKQQFQRKSGLTSEAKTEKTPFSKVAWNQPTEKKKDINKNREKNFVVNSRPGDLKKTFQEELAVLRKFVRHFQNRVKSSELTLASSSNSYGQKLDHSINGASRNFNPLKTEVAFQKNKLIYNKKWKFFYSNLDHQITSLRLRQRKAKMQLFAKNLLAVKSNSVENLLLAKKTLNWKGLKKIHINSVLNETQPKLILIQNGSLNGKNSFLNETGERFSYLSLAKLGRTEDKDHGENQGSKNFLTRFGLFLKKISLISQPFYFSNNIPVVASIFGKTVLPATENPRVLSQSYKKTLIRQKLSKKERQHFRYKTTLYSSLSNTQKQNWIPLKKTKNWNKLEDETQKVVPSYATPSLKKNQMLATLLKKDKLDLSPGYLAKLAKDDGFYPSAQTVLHPLKLYLKKQEAFQKKLKFYGTGVFRKLCVGNNAPFFKLMLKKFFYYYKPTLRYKRTLNSSSFRQGLRKKSRISKKLDFASSKKIRNAKDTENNVLFSERMKRGQMSATQLGVMSESEELAVLPDVSRQEKAKHSALVRITEPSHMYSILGKQASRYRYEIYRDVLQHWYYTPFNRLLLKFDVDSFINRQPKAHFLTKIEESLLHLRRFLLSEHYDTLRWYNYMQHYESMKKSIGGSKSFSSGIYNQQFQGTFKKLRHLFAITPSQFLSSNSNNSGSYSPFANILERREKTNLESVKKSLSESALAEPTSFFKDGFVLKFDQPLYNEYPNTSEKFMLDSSLKHEELKQSLKSLMPSQKKATVALISGVPSPSEFLKTIILHPSSSFSSSSSSAPLLPSSSASAKAEEQHEKNLAKLKSSTVTDERNESVDQLKIKTEIKEMFKKKASALVSFKAPEPTGSVELELYKSTNRWRESKNWRNLNDLFEKKVWFSLLKQTKRQINDRAFLKNYNTHRIEKAEQSRQIKTEQLNSRLKSIKNWLSSGLGPVKETKAGSMLKNSESDSTKYSRGINSNSLFASSSGNALAKLSKNYGGHRWKQLSVYQDGLRLLRMVRKNKAGLFFSFWRTQKAFFLTKKNQFTPLYLFSPSQRLSQPKRETTVPKKQPTTGLRKALQESKKILDESLSSSFSSSGRTQISVGFSSEFLEQQIEKLKSSDSSLAKLGQNKSPSPKQKNLQIFRLKTVIFKIKQALKFVIKPFEELPKERKNLVWWRKKQRAFRTLRGNEKKKRLKQWTKWVQNQKKDTYADYKNKHQQSFMASFNSSDKFYQNFTRSSFPSLASDSVRIGREERENDSVRTSVSSSSAGIAKLGQEKAKPSASFFQDVLPDEQHGLPRSSVADFLSQQLDKSMDVSSLQKKTAGSPLEIRDERTRRTEKRISPRQKKDGEHGIYSLPNSRPHYIDDRTPQRRQSTTLALYKNLKNRSFSLFKKIKSIFFFQKKRSAFYQRYKTFLPGKGYSGVLKAKNWPRDSVSKEAFLLEEKKDHPMFSDQSDQNKRLLSLAELEEMKLLAASVPNEVIPSFAVLPTDRKERLAKLGPEEKENQELDSLRDGPSQKSIWFNIKKGWLAFTSPSDWFSSLSFAKQTGRPHIKRHVQRKKTRKTKVAQKIYKYRKRKIQSAGKIRNLNKKLNKLKAKLELQQWWWRNFLPASQDKLWVTFNKSLFALRPKTFSNVDNTPNGPRLDHVSGQPTLALLLPDNTLAKEKLPNFSISHPHLSGRKTTQKEWQFEKERQLKKMLSNLSFVGSPSFYPASNLSFSTASLAVESQKVQKSENKLLFPYSKTVNPLPFYAGWDENLRKLVITNRFLSWRDAGTFMRELLVEDQPNFNTNGVLLLPKKTNEKIFSKVPLQGLNEASYLYNKTNMSFNVYAMDQFNGKSQSFYAPIGWRRFQFRHSILKTWFSLRRFETSSSLIDPLPSFAKKAKLGEENAQEQMQNTRLSFPYLSYAKSNQTDFFISNQKILTSKNINRRTKKRYTIIKNKQEGLRGAELNYDPTGTLLTEVLPSHYLSVFDHQYRFPNTRYLKMPFYGRTQDSNLTLHKAIDDARQANSSKEIKNMTIDFTLRKRIKTKRKYHRKRSFPKGNLIFPRRRKFLSWNSNYRSIYLKSDIVPSVATASSYKEALQKQFVNLPSKESFPKFAKTSKEEEKLRWRPSIFQKTHLARFSSISQKQENIENSSLNRGQIQDLALNRSKEDKKKSGKRRATTNPFRLRQLRRREFQQIIKPPVRYEPQYGGFVWPGNYLFMDFTDFPKLSLTKTKQSIDLAVLPYDLKSESKKGFSEEQIDFNLNFNSSLHSFLSLAKLGKDTKTKEKNQAEQSKDKKNQNNMKWKIPHPLVNLVSRKYLIQKHNLKVLKKKLEKKQLSNTLNQQVKQLKRMLYGSV